MKIVLLIAFLTVSAADGLLLDGTSSAASSLAVTTTGIGRTSDRFHNFFGMSIERGSNALLLGLSASACLSLAGAAIIFRSLRSSGGRTA